MEHEELVPLTLENSSLIWMSSSYVGLGSQWISWVSSTCVGSFVLLCVPLIPSSSFVSLPRLVLSKPAAGFNSGPQTYAQVVTPRICKGDLIWKNNLCTCKLWILRWDGSGFRVGPCLFVLSYVLLFATPWTVALQAPLFTDFSRQEYWSGLPVFLYPPIFLYPFP